MNNKIKNIEQKETGHRKIPCARGLAVWYFKNI